MNKRYQLRQAAGSYWLLDMEQEGKHYRKPVVLNESGAKIWELLQEGQTIDQIADYLKNRYDIGADEAKQDVRQFTEVLKREGILQHMEV